MTATVTINMDNEAFSPDNGTEVARILRKAADRIEGTALTSDGENDFSLLDFNGNKVGKFTVCV